jgi:hypothetical protein
MFLVSNNTNSLINQFDPIEEKIQSLNKQLQMELKVFISNFSFFLNEFHKQ